MMDNKDKIVKFNLHNQTDRVLDFSDFQKQDVKFDIDELKKAYNEILKIKDFSGPEGISNFGAISLTQIPGDPNSIKGHKARGVFWTKPNSSGKEVVRDERINEAVEADNKL